MNKAAESAVSYGVLLALLAAFMPWDATSAADFSPRALVAVVIAVVGSLVAKAGLALFKRWFGPVSQSLNVPQVALTHRFFGGLWGSIKLSCTVCMVIGLGSILLGTNHWIRPIDAFYTALVAQQLTFIVLELFAATIVSPSSRLGARAATVIAMMGLAIFFAWASNITLFSQTPSVAPPFSSLVSILFAIPAFLAGAAGLLYRYRVERP